MLARDRLSLQERSEERRNKLVETNAWELEQAEASLRELKEKKAEFESEDKPNHLHLHRLTCSQKEQVFHDVSTFELDIQACGQNQALNDFFDGGGDAF